MPLDVPGVKAGDAPGGSPDGAWRWRAEGPRRIPEPAAHADQNDGGKNRRADGDSGDEEWSWIMAASQPGGPRAGGGLPGRLAAVRCAGHHPFPRFHLTGFGNSRASGDRPRSPALWPMPSTTRTTTPPRMRWRRRSVSCWPVPRRAYGSSPAVIRPGVRAVTGAHDRLTTFEFGAGSAMRVGLPGGQVGEGYAHDQVRREAWSARRSRLPTSPTRSAP